MKLFLSVKYTPILFALKQPLTAFILKISGVAEELSMQMLSED